MKDLWKITGFPHVFVMPKSCSVEVNQDDDLAKQKFTTRNSTIIKYIHIRVAVRK